MVVALAVTISCDSLENPQKIKIQLTQDNVNLAQKGIKVVLSNEFTSFEETTNSKGIASFKVPVGIYEATVSYRVRDLRSRDVALFTDGEVSDLEADNYGLMLDCGQKEEEIKSKEEEEVIKAIDALTEGKEAKDVKEEKEEPEVETRESRKAAPVGDEKEEE